MSADRNGSVLGFKAARTDWLADAPTACRASDTPWLTSGRKGWTGADVTKESLSVEVGGNAIRAIGRLN